MRLISSVILVVAYVLCTIQGFGLVQANTEVASSGFQPIEDSTMAVARAMMSTGLDQFVSPQQDSTRPVARLMTLEDTYSPFPSDMLPRHPIWQVAFENVSLPSISGVSEVGGERSVDLEVSIDPAGGQLLKTVGYIRSNASPQLLDSWSLLARKQLIPGPVQDRFPGELPSISLNQALQKCEAKYLRSAVEIMAYYLLFSWTVLEDSVRQQAELSPAWCIYLACHNGVADSTVTSNTPTPQCSHVYFYIVDAKSGQILHDLILSKSSRLRR